MVFLYRAAIVSLVTFASALLGFGLQRLLPPSYVANSKGMISSVVGLDATLLALVLGLLIWTSHGLFTAQQGQLQTIGRVDHSARSRSCGLWSRGGGGAAGAARERQARANALLD